VKLTAELKKRIIEAKAKDPELTHAQLGSRFGVSAHTVYLVLAALRVAEANP
jgi:hypothetical protein